MKTLFLATAAVFLSFNAMAAEPDIERTLPDWVLECDDWLNGCRDVPVVRDHDHDNEIDPASLEDDEEEDEEEETEAEG